MAPRYYYVYLDRVGGKSRVAAALHLEDRKGNLIIRLPEAEGSGEYQGILLYHQGRTQVPIRLGYFNHQAEGNKLEWGFDPGDVAGTGLSLEEFGDIQILKSGRVCYQGRIGTKERAWQVSQSHKLPV